MENLILCIFTSDTQPSRKPSLVITVQRHAYIKLNIPFEQDFSPLRGEKYPFNCFRLIFSLLFGPEEKSKRN